ncbi:MAG TPA: NmrA/HSCARG family protein [Gemmatimonadaceae bacterium]|nr:NmrA/HSCARG family protein [Gemmatimonadaceae bacterium]
MADKKIIAIVGATGAQGGSLARAILADKSGQFAVRAITRNPDGDKAKALKKAGAEVVRADLDDEGSLKKAFTGAYGAFCITNFWEHFSPEKEIAQAGNMARAAKAAGVQHVIWSTLEDTRKKIPLSDDRMPTLMGKYKVPHYDAKGEADQIFRDVGVPTTYLLTSFYWENLIYFGAGPQRGPDGKFALAYPLGDKKLPGIAVEDIGKTALAIFKGGRQYIGKRIAIAGEHLSGKEMADKLSRALGKEIGYNAVTPETYRAFGFPGADDMGNMFQFKRDFNDYYVGARNIQEARKLNPELQTFDQWLEKRAAEIPLK